VYTYEDEEEQQLEQFCGKKHPTQLMSSGQKMKVVFRSQNTQKESNSGFRMEFSFRTGKILFKYVYIAINIKT
jgi:hypothetical protein